MKTWSSTVLAVPALSAFLFLAASPDNVARKCQVNLAPGKYLLALDGVVSERKSDEKMPGVDPNDVYLIDVTCMNPQDSTLARGGTGIPIVVVWTNGPVRQLRDVMSAVVTAQDAVHRRTGKYVSDVAALALPDAAAKMKLTIEAGERGWLARGTMRLFAPICEVYDGEVAGAVSSEPRKVSC